MTTRSVSQKDALQFDDGTIRPWPPARALDTDTEAALEPTHEPRRVGGAEIWIAKDPGEADAD
jgi:hypothetical protein